MNTIRTLPFILIAIAAAGCNGLDKATSPDDTAQPPDDTGTPVDTDTDDTSGSGPADDCPPEVSGLDLEALLVNLWVGSWRGVEDAGWFRFREDGTFAGLAHDPQEPAREDYAGTWQASADYTTITLDYVDPYPMAADEPLDVSQVITPSLTLDEDEAGCTVPVLTFEWSDFDTVEGFESLTGEMKLFLWY